MEEMKNEFWKSVFLAAVSGLSGEASRTSTDVVKYARATADEALKQLGEDPPRDVQLFPKSK